MNQDLETFRKIGYSEGSILGKVFKGWSFRFGSETGLCALMPQLILRLGVFKDDPLLQSHSINRISSTSQREDPKRTMAPFSCRASFS